MIDIKSMTPKEINAPSGFENNSFNIDKRLDKNNKPDFKEGSKYNVDKRADVFERGTDGGSYADVKKNADSKTHEVHHMPADSASNLERAEGPAIKMEISDHRQTASCGASRDARAYQAAQKDLIDNGKFREAVEMDIKDISSKFGSKYDKAISEMLKYVDKLEMEGRI